MATCCDHPSQCPNPRRTLQAGSEIIEYGALADILHWQNGGSEPASSGLQPAPVTGSGRPCRPHVHVCNPVYDYIAPELISLFVTDTGGYTPSYVYRLLAEYYSAADYGLALQL